MKRPWLPPVLILAALIAIAVICICLLAVAGIFLINQPGQNVILSGPTPVLIRPTLPPAPTVTDLPTPVSPGATPALPQVSPALTETLNTLEDATVPVNDLVELAARLRGEQNIPRTLPAPATPFQIGDKKSFWASNVDTNENFLVDATLQYITPHVYFWIQDGVNFSPGRLKDLVDTFEEKIYPTNREFFGSEWTPGVDNDPHLYILYARNLGDTIAGYFYSSDEYTPRARRYSNGHEMFMLSADNAPLSDEYTYGVLAHEFQHMIHWFRDRNEETWMNEGFSDLAMFLNGYSIGGMDAIYVGDPDIQLTDWPDQTGDTTPHYGAAFLFLTYFLDRFGEEGTKALVAEPANGMVSIDQLMASSGVTDPLTGKLITADDIFADWVVATYLKDPKAGDGRYTFHNYPGSPQPGETETVRSCPSGDQTRDVHQYGVDYIRIRCRGDYTLHFEGSTQVPVVPTQSHSGDYAFWSNQGDESDMTLTRHFDFTSISGPLQMSYWTWYDLEKDFDYLYLEASVDGKTWQILTTPSGTDADPIGNSYGWGYTGKSGGGDQPVWIQEQVDLSQFAGKNVYLRFEYITDTAVNLDGMLLDDISIPQIGYQADFEHDDGGWGGEGFVRMQNVLPQAYRLSVVLRGDTTTVQQFALNGSNAIDIPLHITSDVREVLLAVSGVTRFTRQPAPYRFEINQ